MKMILILAAGIALFGGVSPAEAQYYPPPPPPGYAPPPPPGYYPPPPPRRIGAHCEVFLPTPYGSRRMVCPIVDPKPVGRPCACPPPPGYPPDYVGGRTIP